MLDANKHFGRIKLDAQLPYRHVDFCRCVNSRKQSYRELLRRELRRYVQWPENLPLKYLIAVTSTRHTLLH